MDKKKMLFHTDYEIKEKIENIDTRFFNVVIDVLHTGLNLNGSVFDKDVVNANIDSIKNTPILGYIKYNGEEAQDFTDHHYKIVDTDNEIDFVYAGHAYGVIPETCNPRWVTKVADDGVEREYLQVDGILWTKFQDACDIMERDYSKNQSMELQISSVEGIEDNEGIFTFSAFKFDGCCILSTTDEMIQPAMVGAEITCNFSNQNIFDEIKCKLDEYMNISNESKNDIDTVPIIDIDIVKSILESQTFDNCLGEKIDKYSLLNVDCEEAIVFDKMNNCVCGFSISVNEDNETIIDFENPKVKEIQFVNIDSEPSNSNKLFSVISSTIQSGYDKFLELEKSNNELLNTYNILKDDFDKIKCQYDIFVEAENKRIEEEIQAQKDYELEKYESVLSEYADFILLKENKDNFSIDEIKSKCAIMYAERTLNFTKKNTKASSISLGVLDSDDSNNMVETKYGFIPVRKKIKE